MFPEFKVNDTYLFCVREHEEPVVKIIDQALECFENNILGPELYLRMYNQYLYILDGGAEKSLMEFMKQEPPPFLKDCTKRIEGYELLKDELVILRNSIPLNLLSLELDELNLTLFEIIDSLRSFIVDTHIRDNHTHNRK